MADLYIELLAKGTTECFVKEDKPSKLSATLDQIKKDAFEAGFHAGWDYLTTVLHTEAPKVESHRTHIQYREAYRIIADWKN